MTYQPKFFNRLPEDYVLARRGDAEPYVFSEDIVIAVDVALATNRPLLVSGNPGCGKSRLADAVAAVQGWSLLDKTMTSRTRVESLTAEVDQLRRLNDAQAHSLNPDPSHYLNPGLFWWAFQPATARRPGRKSEHRADPVYPGVNRGGDDAHHAVLLIDEIDKAEPDLPNDLLELLDRRRFDLPEGFQVEQNTQLACAEGITLLTVITTNGERELPQAFLRRCVMLELPDPNQEQLEAIALRHFPRGDRDRITAIARRLVDFQQQARDLRRRPPGTAEFLDAIRACEELSIPVSESATSIWKKIETAVLLKSGRA